MTIEEGRKDMQENIKKGYYKNDLKKENIIEDFKKKLLKKFKANDNIYYPYWKAEQFINEVEKELK